MHINEFYINKDSDIPKYQQIIDSITQAINRGHLAKGDRLPSLGKVAKEFDMSINTVVKAYESLKKQGVLKATFGQGFYVATENIDININVFLMLDELNMFKDVLYSSFKETLGVQAKIDVFFHHFNEKVLESMLEENMGKYTHYVIIPIAGKIELVKDFDEKSMFFLDGIPNSENFNYVSQDLNKGTAESLESIKDKITAYSHFNYLFPPFVIEYAGQEIAKGVSSFCKKNSVSYSINHNFKPEDIKKGELYLIARDKELISFIHEIRCRDWRLGIDVGLISYNETELKEIIEGGVTTLSTDFKEMGRQAAEFILDPQICSKKVIPTKVYLRNSL